MIESLAAGEPGRVVEAGEAARRPIGVFDSGWGGLSVLRELQRLLPGEDLVYVADSRFCPYGGRSEAEIQARARAITRYLLVERQVKTVVVACNTATVTAIEMLRAEFDVPFVGMEPAVKPAAAATRRRIVGVLATSATLAGDRFAALLDRVAAGVQVINQPCPGLVELVEAGELDGPRVSALVQQYVEPLLARGADTLVLGCTHYPFLRPAIERAAGPSVAVIDSGAAVARQTQRVLAAASRQRTEASAGTVTFATTGDPGVVAPVLWRLWDAAATVAAVAV